MANTEVLIEKKVVKKQRLYFLDLLKTISIFIVCWDHYNCLQVDCLNSHSFSIFSNYFIHGIVVICVCLFLLVNGYLYLNSEYDIKKHMKKTLKLLCLFIFWDVVLVLTVGSILGHHYNLEWFFNSTVFLELHTVNHLWFLQALFVIYLFFPIIKESYDKENKSSFYWFFAIILLFTFGGVLFNNIVNIYQFFIGAKKFHGDFNFLPGLNPFTGFFAYTLVYFLIGGLLKKYIDQKEKYKKFFGPQLLVPVFLLSTLALFVYGLMMSNVNHSLYDTVSLQLNSIMALLMSLSVFFLCSNFKYENEKINNFLKLVGSNTLGIFVIHRIPGAFFMKYFSLLPHNDNLITNWFFAAFIMLVSLGMVLIIKKIPLLKKTIEL